MALSRITKAFGELLAAETREFFPESRAGGAVGPAGHRERHQLALYLGVRCHGANLRNRHGEPAWCGIKGRLAVGSEKSPLPQICENPRGERFAQSLERLWRQLFGEELDDQRARRESHAALRRRSAGSIGKPSASRDSKYACATSRDNVRMRPK